MSTADSPNSTDLVGSETPETDFEQATAWLRPELIAHCYRMLGSLADAEDRVQETYLKAWRAFHSFGGRSSARTWMYRIATNTCLTSLTAASRRVLPTGLGQPAGDPEAALETRPGETWVEPLPDAVLWGSAQAEPADQLAAREGVALATVAALQELPPNQRAALLLRDVLQFSAAETAQIMGVGVSAVNSALQRARATVGDGLPEEGRCARDLDERERRVWSDFCTAFEAYDIDGVVDLLADQATWEMPPFDRFYYGPAAIGALVRAQCPATGPGDLRMVPCVVNARPAAAMFLRGEDGDFQPFQLTCLEISGDRVRQVVGFFDETAIARALPDWSGQASALASTSPPSLM